MQIPIALQRQAESIKGVDGFLGMVQDRAFKLGEQAWEDAQNIRPAEPIERLPDPRMPDGQPPPENSQVLILLYLDKTGTPLRGHILESKPKELGPTILESALRHRFKPRRIGEEPVAGSVVLPMHWRRPNSEG
ncbi:MAG: hypothetical protein HOH58_13895 [Opitutaceae bacterium]|nr:hypothetical protein [Opitutaceae bacterium]